MVFCVVILLYLQVGQVRNTRTLRKKIYFIPIELPMDYKKPTELLMD
jgi:hypothetical protein